MSETLAALGLEALGYLAGAAALLVGLKFSSLGLDLLPITAQQRQALKRLAPLAGALLLLGYAVLVARAVFSGQPKLFPVAMVLLLAGFVAAAWVPLKDVVTGVFLKLGRVCSPGDTVQVGAVSGKVTEVGHRALTLETSSGEQVVVPYSLVAKGVVSKVVVLSGAQAHAFELSLKPSLDVALAMRHIKALAMRHHWSSVVKVPVVTLLSGRRCRITLYPLTLDHATEIEELIRRDFAEQ